MKIKTNGGSGKSTITLSWQETRDFMNYQLEIEDAEELRKIYIEARKTNGDVTANVLKGHKARLTPTGFVKIS
jgi:hypothetical protein